MSTDAAKATDAGDGGSLPVFWTVAELAAELHMSEGGLRDLCRRRKIPGARRIGRRWIVRRATFEAQFEAKKTGGAKSSGAAARFARGS